MRDNLVIKMGIELGWLKGSVLYLRAVLGSDGDGVVGAATSCCCTGLNVFSGCRRAGDAFIRVIALCSEKGIKTPFGKDSEACGGISRESLKYGPFVTDPRPRGQCSACSMAPSVLGKEKPAVVLF